MFKNTNLRWILGTIVFLLSAASLIIVALLFFQFSSLEKGRLNNKEMNEKLRISDRIELLVRQWLTTNDLIVANGETYLSQSSIDMANNLRDEISQIEKISNQNYENKWSTLNNIVDQIDQLIRSLSNITEEHDILSQYDEYAITLIKTLQEEISKLQNAAKKSQEDREKQSDFYHQIMWGAIAFLILFIFFIWRHAIRAAVLPVEALTDYIEKMSPNDLSYDHKSTGPKEIRELNTSFSILVHEMIKHKKKLEISNADLKLAIQSAKTANRENEEKSQFLANVSHELRTPITSLIGFASIVKKHLEKSIGPALDPENEKALKKLRVSETNIEIIINEGKRLSFLVTDLLDVAKLGAGKIKWNIQSRNLEEIVTEAIKSTQSLFDQGHVKLKKYIPDHLPLVLADKYRIQQVIVNLISNAAKFTHEGSITVTVQSDNDHATVQIKDTGIGIPEKHIKSIFEKFHQVGGDNYVDKPVGTGLGLAICQDIIQHHNGEIWCTSTLGEGSTFCFTIPLHKPSFDAIDAELQCNKLA